MGEIVTTVRQALSLLSGDLRRRWYVLAPWALFSALFEMLATGAMLVLIRLLTDSGAAEHLGPLRTLRQWTGLQPGAGFNAAFAVMIGLLFMVKNSLRAAETYAQERCAAATAVWISSGLLERYLRAPYSLHLRRNSSEMISHVSGAADQVSWVVLQSATALMSEMLVALGILAVLVDQLPPLARGAAALTAGVTILLLWVTQHSHIRWGRVLHETSIQRLQTLRQSLAATKEAKILGREAYFVSRFARIRAALGALETTQHTIEVVPRLVVETTFVLALAGLTLAAWLRPNGGEGLVLTLGIFAYGGLRLLPSLHLVVYRFNRVGSGTAAVRIVARDWEELAPFVSSEEQAGPPIELKESIRLEGVSFSYEESHSGAGERAISDIDLTIQAGESIGIVGPTGSGKTTLADLILGVLKPTCGAILADGRDIHESVRSWHQQIGYVPQTVYLLDDTIRRNIALGVEDGNIDEARVVESAKAAQLDMFLHQLPEGLDTMVGERGAKLSGGERQRIAIARALYRRPSLLVFDEATSALDNLTEQALTATIAGLKGAVTKILIAHRLSTVQSCDRLVFLRGGRIEGIGTYAQLQRNPEFLALTLAGEIEKGVPE
jgi:ATP-binding cassette subfamily C protein